MYDYQALVLDVHDGDTITVDVDLGFRIHHQMELRFLGINAPELKTPEGVAARDYLLTKVKPGDTVRIVTVATPSKDDKREKYGRYLATIYVGDLDVNEDMVKSGHAVRFMV